MSNTIKIGIDLHNLSISYSEVMRTGIQQVLFHVLKVFVEVRNHYLKYDVELIPIFWFPYKKDVHVIQNTKEVWIESIKEANLDSQEFTKNKYSIEQILSMDYFLEVSKTLDWMFFLAIFDTEVTIKTIQKQNPNLKIGWLVYDLVPYLCSELTRFGYVHWFNQNYYNHLSKADVLFGISRNTCIDLLNHIELKKDAQVFATLLPEEETFLYSNTDQVKEVLSKFNLKSNQYFACLSTREPRKNLSLVIQGFCRFQELFPSLASQFQLVLIGNSGWRHEDSKLQVLMQNYSDSILITGYIDNYTKDTLIQNSKALLYPSHYEGFGFPLVLAEKLSVPSITCINSSLVEARLDNTFTSPHQIDEMAIALLKHSQENTNNIAQKNQIDSCHSKWKELVINWIDRILESSK